MVSGQNRVRFARHCAVPLLYLCNGRCLLNFDLIWKYFYPTATIELFANWTSIYSAIRKLLSTLLHTHAPSWWFFFLRLLLFKYNTHLVLSTKIEHDETSRDIHFLTPWNERKRQRKHRKKNYTRRINAIRELKSNDVEREGGESDAKSMDYGQDIHQWRHFK